MHKGPARDGSAGKVLAIQASQHPCTHLCIALHIYRFTHGMTSLELETDSPGGLVISRSSRAVESQAPLSASVSTGEVGDVDRDSWC